MCPKRTIKACLVEQKCRWSYCHSSPEKSRSRFHLPKIFKEFQRPKAQNAQMFVHLCSFKNRASSCRQSDVFYIAGKLYQFILYLIEVLVECASATVLLRLVKALATTQCKARRPSAQLHLGLLSECEM